MLDGAVTCCARCRRCRLSHFMPEHDLRWADEKLACPLNKRLKMRSIHVRPKVHRAVRPTLVQEKPSWIGGILTQRDTQATRFVRDNGSDEIGKLEPSHALLPHLCAVVNHHCNWLCAHLLSTAPTRLAPSNGRAFSGEPSEQSERPERMRRFRCNAMLGGPQNSSDKCPGGHGETRGGHPQPTTGHEAVYFPPNADRPAWTANGDVTATENGR
jgi:hypothetical protein